MSRLGATLVVIGVLVIVLGLVKHFVNQNLFLPWIVHGAAALVIVGLIIAVAGGAMIWSRGAGSLS